MASRVVSYWTTAQKFSTAATAPRMKPFAPAVAADIPDHAHHHGTAKQLWARGEFVPVYVVLGMVVMAVSFGVHSMKQQLAYSPNVRVNKKRRETVPEVSEPDRVVREADRFINKSLFRRVAHIQDFDATRSGVNDPVRPNDPFRMPRRVEDLKTVGVDPRGQ